MAMGTDTIVGDTIKEATELSFGQKLVGINFNPSGDDKVGRAKQLCAELADLLNNEADIREYSYLSSLIFNQAIGDLLNAQMVAVKFLTLKY